MTVALACRAVRGACLAGLVAALGAMVACGPEAMPEGPVVFEVRPDSAKAGDAVVLMGQGFGTTQDAGFVAFGGVPAPVLAWEADRVEVRVPDRDTGETVLVLDRRGERSDPVAFTVVP